MAITLFTALSSLYSPQSCKGKYLLTGRKNIAGLAIATICKVMKTSNGSRPRTLRSFPNRLDYATFVVEGIQQDLQNPFEEAIGSVIFGSPAFANQLQPLVKKPHLIEDAGCRGLGCDQRSLDGECEARRSRFFRLIQCQRTRMLVYGLRRFTQMTGRDIAVAGRCPSIWLRRFSQEMQIQLVKNIEFRNRIEDLAQLFRKRIWLGLFPRRETAEDSTSKLKQPQFHYRLIAQFLVQKPFPQPIHN